MLESIHEFESSLGFSFNNKETLLRAFIHRSFVNENRDFKLGHNERLEFLGDAVLELVMTDELFHRFPKKSEGELTAIRSALVNTTSLSRAARDLNMAQYLQLSKGERHSTGRSRNYILANTFEAVVGAIYEDLGYDKAKQFIADALFDEIDSIVSEKLWVDSKSFLQEKAQKHFSDTPIYKLLEETGPDHDKIFTMGVFINKKLAGTGSGPSKQEAEQDAAREALEGFNWL